MTADMASLMTTEVWREQSILTPSQVCGDVINVREDVSLTECAVYCSGQVVMCFMFEFIYLNNVCRLFSGIASPNGTHLLPWTPFLAYKGLSNCERSGYMQTDESFCFKIHQKNESWLDARTKCEEEEGRLLVMNNPRRVDAILNFAGNLPAYFWIGLYDPNKDGNWKWIDGTTFNTSTWHKVNIDGRSVQYPGANGKPGCMRIKHETQYFHDTYCSVSNSFLCERPQLL